MAFGSCLAALMIGIAQRKRILIGDYVYKYARKVRKAVKS
jgi:hypothetical protein